MSQFHESVDKLSDRFVSDNSNNHIKDTRVSIPVDDTEIHTSTASISKESLNSDMQKIDDELPKDDKLLFESLEKLQDQVLRLKAKQHPENRQKLPSTALKDNYQRIDTNELMSDRVEYLEKKNIQDHLVKFDDSKQLQDKPMTETINPAQDKLDSNVSVTTDLGESHADSKAVDHQHSNELQERIDRLKKDVHNVND